MLKPIIALIIKELLAIWQDKKSRYILIGPPLIQLLIFAHAATLDVKNVSLGILNRDTGKASIELMQRFSGSPIFSHITMLKSEEEMAKLIDTQKITMALHFDNQFSKNISSRKQASVQLILDGRKSNSTQIAAGYASRIINKYSLDIEQMYNLKEPETVLIQRSWFNPNLIYSWFTVPGLVCILTMLVSLILTSLSVARERELGTFDQLLVSPLRPIDILIGKTVPAIVLSMLEGSFILTAAVVLFKIPFTGSLAALYLSMFFFVSAIVGIGLFISSLSQTQQQALLGVFVFMSPAVTLSGFATPVENMPAWLQDLTVINPLRHFLVIVRGLFLKDLPLSSVLTNTYPIALIALFNLTFAAFFFRKRLE